MSDLALNPDEIERRRRERALRLSLYEMPRLRAIGFAFLSLAVYLNNRYILGQEWLQPWLATTVLFAMYTFVSWAVQWIVHWTWKRDLTTLFLVLDVIVWTIAIHATGAEHSFLFFILLVRVADQTQSTFRRCLAFALLGTVCYAAMIGWVVLIDQRPLALELMSVKLVFIVFSGLYIALSARTAERRRANMGRSIHMARDLIRRLETQSAELRDARTKAEEGSAAKSEFVANMSHEMRTPLHGVIGMLQLALAEEESPRRLRQLEMAKRSAEALLGTIDNILDFSKIEARKIDIEPVYFSLRDVVNETVKPLGVTAAAKGLVLSAGVGADVPDSVWGDPLRLRQVLINLIGNAIKFTDAGEIALRVAREGDQVRFDVHDTGVGIPEEQRSRIFDPFAQADESRSRRFGGTGLGLAIVARLVEAMEGTIDVDSEPGVGSVFTFTVPLPSDVISVTPPRASWEGSLAGRHVLVVEPNRYSREIITEVLQTRQIHVTAVASAAEPPGERFACAVTADEIAPVEPAIVITSPLESVADNRLRITRPVVERELIEMIGIALGLTRVPVVRATAMRHSGEQALRVLVAEDNLVNQEFAAEALRRLGHRVSVASDGEEALVMMRREFFDLVLMDVQMPRLAGTDATKMYRELEPSGIHVPIVALTANTRKEDRGRCLEAGMDAVLTKPIDLRQVQEVIRSVTGVEPFVEAMGGNVALLERVRVAFAKQTPGLLQEMRRAIEVSDGDALYRAAHTMKGAVSNFDEDPSVDLSRMLEEAATAGDFQRALMLVVRLEAAVAALERRINAAVLK
jgi:two-component system, sensor histidine kinase and response regulator